MVKAHAFKIGEPTSTPWVNGGNYEVSSDGIGTQKGFFKKGTKKSLSEWLTILCAWDIDRMLCTHHLRRC